MKINWARIARETNLLYGANLRRANLIGADLSGANLSGADLDFSCLPLWCGGIGIKIDAQLARQFLYHALAQNCDDADWVRLTAWESLQTLDGDLYSWPDRRRRAIFTNKLIQEQQKEGRLKPG